MRLREPSERVSGANSIKTEAKFLLMLLMEPPAQTAQRFVGQGGLEGVWSSEAEQWCVKWVQVGNTPLVDGEQGHLNPEPLENHRCGSLLLLFHREQGWLSPSPGVAGLLHGGYCHRYCHSSFTAQVPPLYNKRCEEQLYQHHNPKT